MTQAQWHRIDLPDAPQGHGLARAWGEAEFIAFEQTDGQWGLFRVGPGDLQTETVTVRSLREARSQVEEAIALYTSRAANPMNPADFADIGMKALAGTIIGILLGGLPGVLLHHGPLTIVGTQVGAIAGAAIGASRASEEGKKTKALKKRLLR